MTPATSSPGLAALNQPGHDEFFRPFKPWNQAKPSQSSNEMGFGEHDVAENQAAAHLVGAEEEGCSCKLYIAYLSCCDKQSRELRTLEYKAW